MPPVHEDSRKNLFASRVGLGALAVVFTAFAAMPVANAQSLKIGLSLPMSGTAALLASQFVQGARLALSDLSNGRKIEVVIFDDGCNAELALLAAQEMKAADVAIAAGFLCNDAVPPTAAALKQSGVPLLVSGARSTRLLKDAQKEKWNVWRIVPDDSRAAAAAFEHLSKRWLGKPWALIDDGTVHGRSLADEFRTKMEEAGFPPVFVDNLRPSQSTHAATVRRLLKSGATAAFVAADVEDLATLWTNINEQKAAIELAGSDPLSSLPWISPGKPLPDGLLGVVEVQPQDLRSSGNLTGRLLRENIEPEPHVFHGYAAIQLALAVLQQTPAATTQFLKESEVQTILGPVLFDETGQNRFDNYALQILTKGALANPAELAQ